jgi:hypothetical protein
MFRFTICDVLWLTVVAATGLGWWIGTRNADFWKAGFTSLEKEHRALEKQHERLESSYYADKARFQVPPDYDPAALSPRFPVEPAGKPKP